MKLRTPLFSALAVSGALCACIDEPIDEAAGPDAGALEEAPTDDLAVQDEALPEVDTLFGVYEVGTLWDEDTITVCWEADTQGPELATGRSQTMHAARRWEAVTRLDFVGWQPCDVTPSPDMRIGNSTATSSSYPGTWSRGVPSSMKINLGCIVPEGGCEDVGPDPYALCNGILFQNGEPPPLAECVRTVAVHEFGHALGFRHEHAHADETCANFSENIDPGQLDGEELWSYDPASVMNYCVWSDDLSPGDIRSATSLYPSQVMVYPTVGDPGLQSDIDARVVVGPGKTLASGANTLATGEQIVVSAGLSANVCSTGGSCQTFGVGRHVLPASLANAIASVEVTPVASMHTLTGFRGTTMTAGPGTYHNGSGGTLPWIMNNSISSVYLGHNFDVRLCADAGTGTGAGTCQTFSGGPEWDQALFVKIGPGIDNVASYVEVIPKVAFYDEVRFRGTGATYRQGVYTSQLGFTKAKSLTIPPALYVYACDAITAQNGPAGICRTYNDSVDLPADHAAKLKYVSVQKKIIFQWP